MRAGCGFVVSTSSLARPVPCLVTITAVYGVRSRSYWFVSGHAATSDDAAGHVATSDDAAGLAATSEDEAAPHGPAPHGPAPHGPAPHGPAPHEPAAREPAAREPATGARLGRAALTVCGRSP